LRSGDGNDLRPTGHDTEAHEALNAYGEWLVATQGTTDDPAGDEPTITTPLLDEAEAAVSGATR
jgi:hypothetical protein